MKVFQLVLLILTVCFCIVFIFPLAAPYSPLQVDTSPALLTPSLQHLLGTDALGRDVLSRFLFGGQRTLLMTCLSVSVALLMGVSLGLISGYFGGWIDALVVSVLNALLAMPGLFLALIVITLLGQGAAAVGFAIGISQIAPVGQVTRTSVRSVRSESYVIAAHAIGATQRHIILRVIWLNVLPTLAAYGSVTFAYCLLNVAAFGYLGLVGQPEIPEWGRMLAEGREVYREAIWISIAPGIALTLLVVLANAVGNRISQTSLRG
jgi:ABC-type dipeptide/oligopeptide/nickel transport system permease subunit